MCANKNCLHLSFLSCVSILFHKVKTKGNPANSFWDKHLITGDTNMLSTPWCFNLQGKLWWATTAWFFPNFFIHKRWTVHHSCFQRKRTWRSKLYFSFLGQFNSLAILKETIILGCPEKDEQQCIFLTYLMLQHYYIKRKTSYIASSSSWRQLYKWQTQKC